MQEEKERERELKERDREKERELGRYGMRDISFVVDRMGDT